MGAVELQTQTDALLLNFIAYALIWDNPNGHIVPSLQCTVLKFGISFQVSQDILTSCKKKNTGKTKWRRGPIKMMGVTWVLRPSPLLYFPPSFKNETKKKIHKLTHKPIFKIYVSLIIYRGSYVQIIKKYLSILRQCIAWFEENIFYF